MCTRVRQLASANPSPYPPPARGREHNGTGAAHLVYPNPFAIAISHIVRNVFAHDQRSRNGGSGTSSDLW